MKKTHVLAVLVAGTGAIGMGIAPLALTPTAAAVPGLASFVGKWTGHERTLVIRQTGSGHLTYADLAACPSCSEADANEQNAPVGSDVTAQLAAGSPSGQVLQISMGRMSQFFCNETSVGQCGA